MDKELTRKLQTVDEDSYRYVLVYREPMPLIPGWKTTNQGSLCSPRCRQAQVDPVSPILSTNEGPGDTSDDLLLAQMLQLEFDREHDRMLKAEEKHYNKHSKVHVSLEKYRSLPASYLEDEGDGKEEDSEEEEELVTGDDVMDVLERWEVMM